MNLPNKPRSRAFLLFLLVLALVAAVPPYLVLAHFDGDGSVRILATLLAFVPGTAAIMWVTRAAQSR